MNSKTKRLGFSRNLFFFDSINIFTSLSIQYMMKIHFLYVKYMKKGLNNFEFIYKLFKSCFTLKQITQTKKPLDDSF